MSYTNFIYLIKFIYLKEICKTPVHTILLMDWDTMKINPV